MMKDSMSKRLGDAIRREIEAQSIIPPPPSDKVPDEIVLDESLAVEKATGVAGEIADFLTDRTDPTASGLLSDASDVMDSEGEDAAIKFVMNSDAMLPYVSRVNDPDTQEEVSKVIFDALM